MGFSLVVRSRGHSLVVVLGLLVAVASLIAELVLWAHRPQELWLTSSAVVTLRLSCCVSEIRDLCVLLCPGSGIEPMSPALAGGFFTAEPLGRPMFFNR